MGGVNRVGLKESGNTPGYVRAQSGRARSALFSRVPISYGLLLCPLNIQVNKWKNDSVVGSNV